LREAKDTRSKKKAKCRSYFESSGVEIYSRHNLIPFSESNCYCAPESEPQQR
jgi:hypothetical protein